MGTGDTVLFRGQPRFVLLNKPGKLWLARVRENRYVGQAACYSVSSAEKAVIRVLSCGTEFDVQRARRLLETGLMPWTRIVWGPDGLPSYHHDVRWFAQSEALL